MGKEFDPVSLRDQDRPLANHIDNVAVILMSIPRLRKEDEQDLQYTRGDINWPFCEEITNSLRNRDFVHLFQEHKKFWDSQPSHFDRDTNKKLHWFYSLVYHLHTNKESVGAKAVEKLLEAWQMGKPLHHEDVINLTKQMKASILPEVAPELRKKKILRKGAYETLYKVIDGILATIPDEELSENDKKSPQRGGWDLIVPGYSGAEIHRLGNRFKAELAKIDAVETTGEKASLSDDDKSRLRLLASLFFHLHPNAKGPGSLIATFLEKQELGGVMPLPVVLNGERLSDMASKRPEERAIKPTGARGR